MNHQGKKTKLTVWRYSEVLQEYFPFAFRVDESSRQGNGAYSLEIF
jgi:hypothetical protein